jgi:hypothetical protein
VRIPTIGGGPLPKGGVGGNNGDHLSVWYETR